MKNEKVYFKKDLYISILQPASNVLLLIIFFSYMAKGQTDFTPTFKVYTDWEEVDIKDGILPTTPRLFVRAENKDGMKFKVSSVEATLVSGGRGHASIKGDGVLDLSELLAKRELSEDAILSLEISIYYTKNSKNVIEKVELKKPVFMKIPIIRQS